MATTQSNREFASAQKLESLVKTSTSTFKSSWRNVVIMCHKTFEGPPRDEFAYLACIMETKQDNSNLDDCSSIYFKLGVGSSFISVAKIVMGSYKALLTITQEPNMVSCSLIGLLALGSIE